MRLKIAAGNWKMNTDLNEGLELASEVVNMAGDEVNGNGRIILIPPFTHLHPVKKIIGGAKNIFLGAQNCHQETSGAYTGEVSVGMLKSLGVSYIVIGHSERREYFNESNELLARKVNAVLSNDLTPIFCCGEKLEVREAGDHFKLVEEQVKESLFHLEAFSVKNVVIAYEPVWAIGTGKTASAQQAQEMHAFIRSLLTDRYGEEIAESISILYGGSVKPANAKELFSEKDVDGGLVGGASLDSRGFVNIAKSF